jgi:hypothetical protein
MSCTLTEYRKPRPRYGLADAGWRAHTPWELAEGRWRRLYVLGCPRGRIATRRLRRAEVFRRDGVWAWRVLERRGYGAWAEVARAGTRLAHTYWAAQMAMPYADLAARTR